MPACRVSNRLFKERYMKSRYVLLIGFSMLMSACKTEPEPPPPQTLDEVIKKVEISSLQVIPTADGGAYIITDYGVWRVKDDKAKKVIEDKIVSQSQSSSLDLQKGHLFALWQYRKKQQEIEERGE